MDRGPSRFDAWLCRIRQVDGVDRFRFSSAPAGKGAPTPAAECLGTNLPEEELRRLEAEIRQTIPGVEVDTLPAARDPEGGPVRPRTPQ
jgi:hypothetical protein